ncbi:hypothetical protein E2C01_089120 [Portunus trituberculatus]|uniref:Uncharacterized protein n=1 Tax=Portunus trituberculatus TaxID=210409 RepID=A0A5B7JCN8_PORTR|nr:hypothetical protein [Portunus trituberculatus]
MRCEGEGRLQRTVSLTASVVVKISCFLKRLHSLLPSPVRVPGHSAGPLGEWLACWGVCTEVGRCQDIYPIL